MSTTGNVHNIHTSFELVGSFNRTLQQAIDDQPFFQPALPFLGGHGQTVLGHFLSGPKLLERSSQKVIFELSDGDLLHGRLYSPEVSAAGSVSRNAIVHIFHGLAGSADSGYMPRAAAACVDLGLRSVLWNHRGCGEGRHSAIGTYHSGRSDDLARVVHWGRHNYPGFKQIVIGFSLSGNAAILLNAGIIPSSSTDTFSRAEIQELFNGDLPDFTIAVNPPLDLYQSARRLTQSASRIYGQRFMFDLIECLNDRASIRIDKDDTNSARLQSLAIAARAKLRPWHTVIDFDRHYTGLAGGFSDHMDYYRRASSGPALDRQVGSLVILTADDDPITHGLNDLSGEQRIIKGNRFVLDQQAHGGHMGFVDKELLGLNSSWTHRWMERRLQLYLEQYIKMYLVPK